MCSKNTSNSRGVRGMANASGVGDYYDYESSSLRKAKKQRVPKRGPGVAELEKILREQEKKDGHLSLVPSLPNVYPPPSHSSFASSSNSLPRKVSFLAGHHRLGNTIPSAPPPVTALPGNIDVNGSGRSQLGCGNVGGNGRSKGVYIDGSGVFLPDKTLLPITWGSSETCTDEEAPKIMATDFSFPILASNASDHNKMLPPPILQKNHGPCHLSMMDLFPLSAISSSSTPSSSTGVYHHHVEPPSNQKSYHSYTSTILPEEDKMMGAKRSRPNFPVDNWRLAPPHMACQPPPFRPQVSRLDPSSSSSNNGLFNLGISRDPVPTNPLELNVKMCVNDHGNLSGVGSSLIKLGSPTTFPSSTQNCQPDLSKFIKQFPFPEENTEGCILQRSSSESEVSVYNKSFFSFLLQPEEQSSAAAEATLGLKSKKSCTEKTEDFIDLNLKL